MKELKEAVLEATFGGRRIFEELYPDSKQIFANNGKGFIRIRDEKTASAAFKLIEEKGKTSYWILRDFGSDTTMNAIDAYMHENGIRYFSEAVHRLAEQYGVDNSLKESVNKPKITSREAKPEEKEGEVKYETRDLTEAELKIMGPMVKKETMEKYNYKALKWYSTCKYNKDKGKLMLTTFYSTEDYPMFIHECGKFQKVYKPCEVNKAYRFFSIGIKPQDYIFGLEEAKKILDEKAAAYKRSEEGKQGLTADYFGLAWNKKDELVLDKIIICSGERDAMCLAAMGFIPIWFNSESAKKSVDVMKELFKIADKTYNVPDMDETGVEKGYELAREYPEIYTIQLPAWLKTFKDARLRPCKDLRDFVELRPNREEFKRLINMAQRAKFWHTNDKDKVEINSLSLLFFLKIHGFCKYKDDITKETKYIRINGYTITEYEPGQIRDYVRQSLFDMQAGNPVVETFINSRKTTNKIYEDLEPIEINFDSSDKNGRTLFFQNCCVTIHNNLESTEKPEDSGISITYKPTNNMYIWDNKIIPHRFKRLKPSFTYDWVNGTYQINLDNNPSKVMRYLINASRLYWREELEKYNLGIDDEDECKRINEEYAKQNQFNLCGPRLANDEYAIVNQLISFLNKVYVIGYLMHQYKIPSSAKAIWAMEWKNNDEGVSNGRSGKSLMFQCLEKLGLAEMVTLNGRNSKLTDNNHFMDRVSKKTDILLIDDADRNLDFNTFYAMITGSTTINPKNEKSFELRYEDAPNLVFTSNYPIPNNDASTMARILFVAFSDYYHVMSDNTDYKEERKVNHELGDLFTADYTEDEYNADINFFIDCLQFYLSCLQLNVPAIRPPMESIHKRILRQKMGEAFLQWAREFFNRDGRFVNAPVIRQAAYEDYCRTIERKAEQKGKTGWINAVRDYVKYCDDLKCFNPENHPFRQEDGRMIRTCEWRGVTKSYELIYIQTVNNELFTQDVAYT